MAPPLIKLLAFFVDLILSDYVSVFLSVNGDLECVSNRHLTTSLSYWFQFAYEFYLPGI